MSDAPTREQQLSTALRSALELAARLLEDLEHEGAVDQESYEEKTARIGELMKVLEEK